MLWLLGIPIVLIAAAFLYWQLRYPTHTYRFELVVEVETPSGLRSGSSIYEVSARNLPEILPEGATREWAVRGEAVAVELPDGQTLFALMQPDLARTSLRALDPGFGGDIVASAARVARGEGRRSKSVLAEEDLPLLVTFDDLSDSTSVRKVAPSDFEPTLGKGYRLKLISAETSKRPVTTGIREHLPWLSMHPEPRLDPGEIGSTKLPSFSEQLSHGDFFQGTSK